MPRARLLANAGIEAGGGHLSRTTVLANALANLGWTCTIMVPSGFESVRFVPTDSRVQFELHPQDCFLRSAARSLHRREAADLLVVDHYGADAGFETLCREHCRMLMAIVDASSRHHCVDLLLDQNLDATARDYAERVPRGTRLLLGARYALLRPDFSSARSSPPVDRVGRLGRRPRVLVSVGAVDDLGLTEQVTGEIRSQQPGTFIDVVLGAGSPNAASLAELGACSGDAIDVHLSPSLAELIALMRADVAVGAGGVSALERCVLGIPSIILVLADNQAGNANALQDAEAAVLVDLSDGWPRRTTAAIADLLGDRERLDSMSRAAAALCDGQGAQRVARAIQDRLLYA